MSSIEEVSLVESLTSDISIIGNSMKPSLEEDVIVDPELIIWQKLTPKMSGGVKRLKMKERLTPVPTPERIKTPDIGLKSMPPQLSPKSSPLAGARRPEAFSKSSSRRNLKKKTDTTVSRSVSHETSIQDPPLSIESPLPQMSCFLTSFPALKTTHRSNEDLVSCSLSYPEPLQTTQDRSLVDDPPCSNSLRYGFDHINSPSPRKITPDRPSSLSQSRRLHSPNYALQVGAVRIAVAKTKQQHSKSIEYQGEDGRGRHYPSRLIHCQHEGGLVLCTPKHTDVLSRQPLRLDTVLWCLPPTLRPYKPLSIEIKGKHQLVLSDQYFHGSKWEHTMRDR